MKATWKYSMLLLCLFLSAACEKEAFLPDQVSSSPHQDITGPAVEFRHDASTPTSSAERQALVDFYLGLESTGSLSWPVDNAESDPCMDSWSGISCEGGKIIQVRILNQFLKGPISEALSDLPDLQYLVLSGNRLTGPIPRALGHLRHLVNLNLGGGNRLTGSIPKELGLLTGMRVLDLSNNQLTGAIPPELGNLPNLRDLRLNQNHLSGAIPSELGKLPSLSILSLFRNHLSGSIPEELGNLSSLTSLRLSFNELSGPIPPQLGSLSSLANLILNNNQLSGPIPPELGDLSGLSSLVLAHNQLSGSIPPALGNLKYLALLNLADNQLSGSVPPELSQLDNLYSLRLSHNQLSGAIPPDLGNMAELLNLSLDSNQLHGPIPPTLGNLSRLEFIDLSNNRLHEFIPPELGDLTFLYEIDLSANQLDGAIPGALGKLPFLNLLDLQENQLDCYELGLRRISPATRVFTEGNPGLPSWTEFLSAGAGTCSVDPGEPIGDMLCILVDAKRHVPILTLSEGDVLDQADFPLKVNIEVEFPVLVDEVRLTLAGPGLSEERLESKLPFTLFGDRGGEYNGEFLPRGAFTLTATPYIEGIPSPPLTRNFTVVGPSTDLSGFTLLDANSNAVLGPLSEGDHVMPTGPLAIRVEASGEETGSVFFRLEGPLAYEQKENAAPFSLFGNRGEDYFGKLLPAGAYTLWAKPYSRRNGHGEPGPALQVHFTIGRTERLER